MKKRISGLAICVVMVIALVLTSCAPAEVEEEKKPVSGEKEQKEEAVVEEKEEAVAEEKEMVLDALGRLVEKPQYGGTLTSAYQAIQAVKSFHVDQPGYSHQGALCVIYEGLLTADWAKGPAGTNENSYQSLDPPEYYWKGALAESWEVVDPYTFVFKLRKGVRFQNIPPVNGREVTSDDVVYCTNFIKESARSADSQWFRDRLESVEALDKYTVEFKVNEESFRSLAAVGKSTVRWIFPREMMEKGGGSLEDWQLACGTGPFMIDDFVIDSSLTYKKNPDYWGYDELHPDNRLPYIDTLVSLIILDPSTQLAALRTGKIDMLGASPETAASLKETRPELKWTRYVRNSGEPVFVWRIDHEPFNDIRVRRALLMSIDFNTIVNEFFKGDGVLLSFPLCAAWSDVYTPLDEQPQSVQENFSYNPERAKQLLAEAGYPDGFETEILTYAYDQQVEIYQGYWANIGIDAKIRMVDYGTFVSQSFGRVYDQIAAVGCGQTSPFIILSMQTSKSFFNIGMVNDPHIDQQIEEVEKCFDAEKRNKMFRELGVYILEQANNVAFPASYLYMFWWPWIKNYNGELTMGSIYDRGPIWARVWFDRDLRQEMGY